MPNTIELDLPKSSIEGAVRRLIMLTDSGYLPPALKSDLETVVHAALAWDTFKQKPLSEHLADQAKLRAVRAE
jgi:hypothetical protein